jgi:hypothetical protein
MAGNAMGWCPLEDYYPFYCQECVDDWNRMTDDERSSAADFMGRAAVPEFRQQLHPARDAGALPGGDRPCKRVIRAIAPSSDAPLVGYAVFGQKPDRERESGFEHIAVSAVADHLAQAQIAYDYCVDKGEVHGCKYFVICQVRQIST